MDTDKLIRENLFNLCSNNFWSNDESIYRFRCYSNFKSDQKVW